MAHPARPSGRIPKAALKAIERAFAKYQRVHRHYDETFWEANAAIMRKGFASKFDISALLVWKRLNLQTPWTAQLLELSEGTVESTTKTAFQPGLGDASRLMRLSALPGFGRRDAVASALLAAWQPTNFGVVDGRARTALRVLGLTEDQEWVPYVQYLVWLRSIRDALAGAGSVVRTCRDVDKALFELGDDPGMGP